MRDSMSVFLAVVAAGSFSGASRQLRMPLPTVSRKVSELESHIKARPLTRTTRRLTLTEAGNAYVAACKRILEDVAEAERNASGEYQTPRGELIATAPMVFGRLQRRLRKPGVSSAAWHSPRPRRPRVARLHDLRGPLGLR